MTRKERNPKDIKIGDYTLEEILKRNKHWLNEDCEKWEYMRADLRDADLRDAYLHGANLSCADLSGANIRNAYLYDACLHCADLSGANLSGTDLSGADLRGADLRDADLSGADLSCATCICLNERIRLKELVQSGLDIQRKKPIFYIDELFQKPFIND